MTGQYQVRLHSQLGPRDGILTLEGSDGYVSGSLELMGHRNAVQGVLTGDGSVHIFHAIRTSVGTMPCETVLELDGASLTGTTTTNHCRIRWEGCCLSKESKP